MFMSFPELEALLVLGNFPTLCALRHAEARGCLYRDVAHSDRRDLGF